MAPDMAARDTTARRMTVPAGTAPLSGEVREMDPTVAAWALMGIGELIGMRWVLWDEEGAEPALGARPDVSEDAFEEMMKFIERALAPTPGATPGAAAGPGPGPAVGTNQTLEGTAP